MLQLQPFKSVVDVLETVIIEAVPVVVKALVEIFPR